MREFGPVIILLLFGLGRFIVEVIREANKQKEKKIKDGRMTQHETMETHDELTLDDEITRQEVTFEYDRTKQQEKKGKKQSRDSRYIEGQDMSLDDNIPQYEEDIYAHAEDLEVRDWQLDAEGEGWEEDWKEKLKATQEEARQHMERLRAHAAIQAVKPMERKVTTKRLMALSLSPSNILNGILFSQIFAPPRARNKKIR